MLNLNSWFYGGRDKEFFIRHADEITEINTKTIRNFGLIVCSIVVIFTLSIMLVDPSVKISYLVIESLILIAFNILFWLVIRHHPKTAKYYFQVVLISLAVFLLVWNSIDASTYAVLMPLFLVVMPLLLIAPVHEIGISTVVLFAVYSVLSIAVKGYTEYAMYDIIDGLIAVVFGFFMGGSILKLRIDTIDAYDKLKKSSESELARALHLANIDPLTGVKSRAAYETVVSELDADISSGRIREFAVVVCDVNGLKKVNDSIGHDAGDKLIISCAGIICSIFDHSPVFRIGGDEFLVLLQGRDFAERDVLMEKVRDANETPAAVSFAYGIAEFNPETDKQAKYVFVRADEEMYRCKKKQRAKVRAD